MDNPMDTPAYAYLVKLAPAEAIRSIRTKAS